MLIDIARAAEKVDFRRRLDTIYLLGDGDGRIYMTTRPSAGKEKTSVNHIHTKV